MISIKSYVSFSFTLWMKTLQNKMYYCNGTWRYCNYLKENYYSAQLRLAMHRYSSTFYPCPTKDSRIIKEQILAKYPGAAL